MARNKNGYFKLQRRIIDHWVFEDDQAFKVWIVLLSLAAWKPGEDILRKQRITLKIGQLVTSWDELAGLARVDRKTIKRKLELLKTATMLDYSTDYRGTVITICNYEKYQTRDTNEGTAEGTAEGTTEGTAEGTAEGTDTKQLRNKEIKNKERTTKTVTSDLGFDDDLPKAVSSKNKQPTDGSKIWQEYSAAYRHRYGIEPKRNSTTNSQCSNLAKRLGVDDAIAVVHFYLSHAKSWYVQNSHSIGLCLKDAEALYTQMKTNNRVTASRAADIDRGSEQAEVFERVTRKLEKKYEGK